MEKDNQSVVILEYRVSNGPHEAFRWFLPFLDIISVMTQ